MTTAQAGNKRTEELPPGSLRSILAAHGNQSGSETGAQRTETDWGHQHLNMRDNKDKPSVHPGLAWESIKHSRDSHGREMGVGGSRFERKGWKERGRSEEISPSVQRNTHTSRLGTELNWKSICSHESEPGFYHLQLKKEIIIIIIIIIILKQSNKSESFTTELQQD